MEPVTLAIIGAATLLGYSAIDYFKGTSRAGLQKQLSKEETAFKTKQAKEKQKAALALMERQEKINERLIERQEKEGRRISAEGRELAEYQAQTQQVLSLGQNSTALAASIAPQDQPIIMPPIAPLPQVPQYAFSQDVLQTLSFR